MLKKGGYMKGKRSVYSNDALKTNIIFDVEAIYLVKNQGKYVNRSSGGKLSDYTPYNKRFVKMIHTYDGAGEITSGENTFYLTPGTVVFLEYNEKSITELPGGTWEYCVLWFFSENIDLPINVLLNVPELQGEKRTIKKIVSLIDKRDYISTAQANGLALALVAEILSKTNFKSDKLYMKDIRDAIDYINSATDKKLTVGELTKTAHLSEKHFRNLFERFVGMSPKQYIIKAKMEKAMFYLRNTSLSIEEIADKLAYSSTTHFIITFAKRYNLTPLNYRKQNEKEE